MKDLFLLMTTKDSNKQNIEKIIDLFEPKIKKSVLQTTLQDREDLGQILKIKTFESIQKYDWKTVPGFFEFCESVKKIG